MSSSSATPAERGHAHRALDSVVDSSRLPGWLDVDVGRIMLPLDQRVIHPPWLQRSVRAQRIAGMLPIQ